MKTDSMLTEIFSWFKTNTSCLQCKKELFQQQQIAFNVKLKNFIIIFLYFWGIPILFSTAAESFDIPINSSNFSALPISSPVLSIFLGVCVCVF